MAKRTLRVADLLSDDAQATNEMTDAQEQQLADEAAVAATFAVVPNAPKKQRSIAEIAAAAEQLASEVPIKDRLGKAPKAERVGPKAEKPAKEPKAPKELPFCQCGCGERTGGGRFLPGHDAKLKSRLFVEARSEDSEVAAEARQQLSDRNWLHLMGEKKAPKAKVTTGTVEAVIAAIKALPLSEQHRNDLVANFTDSFDEFSEDESEVTDEEIATA